MSTALIEDEGSVADVSQWFKELADRWREETGMLSSVSKILQHPAYLQIVVRGRSERETVLPLILRDLRDRKGLWFQALETISGESPVPDDIRSNPKRVREVWLQWGREHNYLPR